MTDVAIDAVTFYDPHPGLAGCAMRFPETLRVVAQWLDGKTMTVEQAVQCFMDAIPEQERSVTINAEDDWISVKMGSMTDFPIQCWRAILFKRSDRTLTPESVTSARICGQEPEG